MGDLPMPEAYHAHEAIMQELTASQAAVASLRAEFQKRFEDQQSQLQQLQQWKNDVLVNVQQSMKRQLEAALSSTITPVPAKKQKVVHKSGRICRICGDPGVGRDVHRHRELGIYLDGKCRKQVDTFRHGGCIQERRAGWSDALREASHCELAQKMLAALGQVDAPSSPALVSRSYSVQDGSISVSDDGSSDATLVLPAVPADAEVETESLGQMLDDEIHIEGWCLPGTNTATSPFDICMDMCTGEDDMVRTISDDLVGLLTPQLPGVPQLPLGAPQLPTHGQSILVVPPPAAA